MYKDERKNTLNDDKIKTNPTHSGARLQKKFFLRLSLGKPQFFFKVEALCWSPPPSSFNGHRNFFSSKVQNYVFFFSLTDPLDGTAIKKRFFVFPGLPYLARYSPLPAGRGGEGPAITRRGTA